jgi:hypothetical protein
MHFGRAAQCLHGCCTKQYQHGLHRHVEAAGVCQTIARLTCLDARRAQVVAVPAVDGHRVLVDPHVGSNVMFEMDQEYSAWSDHDMIGVADYIAALADFIGVQHEPSRR